MIPLEVIIRASFWDQSVCLDCGTLFDPQLARHEFDSQGECPSCESLRTYQGSTLKEIWQSIDDSEDDMDAS